MKRIGVGAVIALAVPAAVLLLASGAIGLALAMGWVLSRLVALDLFQATLICLVALFGAGLAMARGAAAAIAFLAARTGTPVRAAARSSRGEPAPAPMESRELDGQGAEGDSPRRRSRFDA